MHVKARVQNQVSSVLVFETMSLSGPRAYWFSQADQLGSLGVVSTLPAREAQGGLHLASS